MTTATFSRLAGPTARAMAAVHAAHCRPPSYRPAAAVRGIYETEQFDLFQEAA